MNCRDHGPWLELEPFPSNPSLAPPQTSKGPQLPVSTGITGIRSTCLNLVQVGNHVQPKLLPTKESLLSSAVLKPGNAAARLIYSCKLTLQNRLKILSVAGRMLCHTPQNIIPYWSYQTTSNSSLSRPIDIPLAQLFITFHIIRRLFPSQSADICMSSPHLFGCCTRSINDKSWGLSPSRRHLMR